MIPLPPGLNPAGWLVDGLKGAGAQAAGGLFGSVVHGMTSWVMDAVMWVVGAVFRYLAGATGPDVRADWFLRPSGPYATMVQLAAVLLVGFVLVGITQGVLAGDVGGMLRRVGFELPAAVLAMAALVTLTQSFIALTDALSNGLLGRFDTDASAFVHAVNGLAAMAGPGVQSLVVVLLGLVAVLAGLVVVAELVVRAALVYIVVALAPLVFAAQVWPALRSAGRKLIELLVALVVSKLVIALALSVAAAAAVGAGQAQSANAPPAPEVQASSSEGASVGQAVGILLAAGAAFGVAAFSPLLVTRLLPLTEAAMVAHGVRGMPVRAGQQAMSASYYAQMGKARLGALASHPAGQAGGGPGAAAEAAGGSAASGSAAGGSAAGGPAAAGAAAARTATRAAGAGAAAATANASESANDAATRRPPPQRPPGHRPPRRPPASEGPTDGS
ncbi:MAG TPA: hypothetical protein VFJ85_08495 [Acidimicrobiales bacterium]|nr:hypothetical protein [Acidimicrobiales bacterium]